MIVLLVLLAIAASFLFPWKLNFLRGTIADKVEQSTGRRLTVDGDLTLYWLQGPRITADKLRFANPAWASRPDMLTVDRIDTTISLLDLIRKRVVLPRVKVDAPVLHLEQSADGRRNWYLDRQQSDSSTAVVLDALTLDKAHVAYVVKHKDTDVEIDLATVNASDLTTGGDGKTSRIALKASGKWNGLKLAGEANGEDLLRLRNAHAPYAMTVKATVGRTRIAADGSVTGITAPTAADFRLDLSGATLGEWLRIAGVGLPETPAYRTAGRVRLADGVWHYDDFTGKFGVSDIAGSVTYERRERDGKRRPFISGKLVSKELDLADFAPTVGKAPTSQAASADKTPASASARTLPQRTFSTDKWNTLDANIRFEAKDIKNAGSIPFDNLDMHVTMQDTVLSFTPLSFGFANGKMGGNFRFDGSANPIRAHVDARFADLQLDRLTPSLKRANDALGRLNGTVKLDGRGNSIATMLGTSNGTAQIAMGRGQLSSLLLELIGLQGPQIVRYLLGDRDAKVRCAVADLGMKNGDLSTKSALIDTDLNVIKLEGHADFADEQINLTVTPLPKKPSIVVLRTPFHVTGSFAQLSVKPDYGTLAARGGGALALGLLNPFAALIPLIETGPGTDTDCAGLIAAVKNAPVKNTDDVSQLKKPAGKPAASKKRVIKQP